MFWLDLLGLGNGAASEDPRLPQAIERAVERVEPRLKQVGGYPGRYRAAIALALRYSDQLAGAIPGPLELDPEHFFRDPLVQAVFTSHEDIQHMLLCSRAMRKYQRSPDAGPDIHALMGMRRTEKKVFGMEIEGAVLRRDVAQQSITFSDHILSCIAADETGARALVAWLIFDGLIAQVANHIEALRQEKNELGQRRDDIMARLRGSSGERRVALEQELDLLLSGLMDATQRLNLDRMPGYFEALLRTPETLVRLEQRQFRLDGMGIQRTRDDASISHLLTFTDLLGQDRRRWNVTLVRFPYQELPPLSERLEDANRWLAI